MGMIVWRIKPEKAWARVYSRQFFDAYDALGYDIIASNQRLRAQDLLEAYNAAFSQHCGVSHMSFKEFNDGTTATTRILEQINKNVDLRRDQSLVEKITSSFQNLPYRKEDSFLCLKYLLENDISWEKILDFCLFEDAAQDYGYTILRHHENTNFDVNEVESNLRQVYTIALKGDPKALHQACKECKLAEYVPEVCSNNSWLLHRKALEILQTAGCLIQELQSLGGPTRHETLRSMTT